MNTTKRIFTTAELDGVTAWQDGMGFIRVPLMCLGIEPNGMWIYDTAASPEVFGDTPLAGQPLIDAIRALGYEVRDEDSADELTTLRADLEQAHRRIWVLEQTRDAGDGTATATTFKIGDRVMSNNALPKGVGVVESIRDGVYTAVFAEGLANECVTHCPAFNLRHAPAEQKPEAAKVDDGGPAYPSEQGHIPDGTWNQTYDPGMSIRQHYAGLAMQALLIGQADSDCGIKGYVHDAVLYADALIAELRGGG